MRWQNLLSMCLFLVTLLTAGLQFSGAPQAAGQEGRHLRGEVVTPTGTGQSLVTPGVVPLSLNELVRESDVIVEGVVQSVLPSRLRTPSDASSVETDSVFSVTRVFKGRAENLRTIVVTQIGGKYGDFELQPVQYDLLRAGDHHILFLTADSRPIVPRYPSVDGAFSITGIWSGNFRIENNAIKVSPRAMPEIRKLDSGKIEEFATKVVTAARAVGQ